MKNLTARLALCLGALLLIAFTNTDAHAEPVIIGNATGSQATASVTGYSLTGNSFRFTIRNTSPYDARITGIGFDLPGAPRDGFSLVSTTSTNFTLTESAGNVPQFNSADLDFALVTGNSGNFNGGSPNQGIAPGASATFTVTGNFAGFTADQLVSSIFVRFQRVGANGAGSDVGVLTPGTPSNPNAPVPEPATLLLLGTGLAGTARAVRRRRARSADEQSAA